MPYGGVYTRKKSVGIGGNRRVYTSDNQPVGDVHCLGINLRAADNKYLVGVLAGGNRGLQAPRHDRAAGIMVGRPMRWGCEEMGMTFADATLAALADAGVRVPVLLDCDFGHLPPQMPLVCGSLADVECSPAGAADGAAARRVSVRMGLVP